MINAMQGSEPTPAIRREILDKMAERKRAPRPDVRREKEAVISWNVHYSAGLSVRVMLADSSFLNTVTCGPAKLVGGHTAGVPVVGVEGFYALDRCEPI